MKPVVLLVITLYQRYISPYKGFHCAFATHTGRDTCSGYGYRVFSRYGTLHGYALLQRRFAACSKVARQHSRQVSIPQALRQGGFVDCGDCSVPSCDLTGCDAPSCQEAPCDVMNCCVNPPSSLDGCGRGRHQREQREYYRRARNQRLIESCKERDCADWLNLLLVLALIAGVLYLAYYYWPK